MAAAVDDPFALAGASLENRFAVERVVARGGFGIVYQGRHLALRKTVAVKVLFIPREFGPQEQKVFLDCFAAEARTIAQLDHPAIVRVFDFGVSRSPNGREIPWMALEWIEGQSLADFLKARRGRPMSPADALALMRPVFQGLAYAHGMPQPIAHRDIKPANIMLAAVQGGAQGGIAPTKLLDFGIAKVMNPEEDVGAGDAHTRALFTAFSLPYAAPEQVSAFRTGPWTDVHALALILTELLVDRAPYGGGDKVQVTSEVMAAARPTPRRFGVDVGAWEPVLARALAVRPAERFQNAAAFLLALDEALPGAGHARAEAAAAASRDEAPQPPSTLRPHAAAAPPSPRRASVARAAAAFALVAVPLVAVVVALHGRGGRAPSARDAGLPIAAAASRYAMSDEVAPADAGPPPDRDADDADDAGDAPAQPRSRRPGGRRPTPRPSTFHGLPSGQI